jgi:hypothetical protein
MSDSSDTRRTDSFAYHSDRQIAVASEAAIVMAYRGCVALEREQFRALIAAPTTRHRFDGEPTSC